MDQLHEKFEKLKEVLRSYQGAAVAFSGGVDSSFLLAAASETLGDKVLAVTASSTSFPRRELEEAIRFCRERGIRQEVFHSDELAIEGFRQNPPNRCYLCKKHLFSRIFEIAEANGLPVVAEGSNLDDEGDYRPGLMAVKEMGAKSPLRAAGLTKQDIRDLSKEMGLPTWEKPSFACLASRFPYGETIDEQKLDMVDRSEEFLSGSGFRQVRVRIHDNLARIEVMPEDFDRLTGQHELIAKTLKEIGFTYVAMDLTGYRTGSMNETLKLS